MFTILDVLPPIKGVRSVAGASFYYQRGERVRDSLPCCLVIFFPKNIPTPIIVCVSEQEQIMC